MKLPDPKPLQSALKLATDGRARLADLATEKTALEAEIESHIQRGELPDDATMQHVAGRRVRLDCLPAVVKRVEGENAAHFTALVNTMDGFGRDLAGIGIAERDALLAEIESILKPFAPDYIEANGEVRNVAQAIARHCPVFNVIPVQWSMLRAPEISDNPAEKLPSAIARAAALLAIHAELQQRGTFIPAAHPAAARHRANPRALIA